MASAAKSARQLSTRLGLEGVGGAPKEAGVGSGLWRVVCQGIISRDGGDLDVASVAGKGSCFWIRLPDRDAMAEAATPTA